MTVIVAVSDGKRVCMACDSQTTNDNGTRLTMATPKVLRIGPALIGGDGSHALAHYLRHEYRATFGDDAEVDVIAKTIAENFRAWLTGRNMLCESNAYKAELPGQFLVAKGSRFVLVDGGGYVIYPASPFWAIGCGGAEARGAMWVQGKRETVIDAGAVARNGVEAAIALDSGCGPPVCVEWTT